MLDTRHAPRAHRGAHARRPIAWALATLALGVSAASCASAEEPGAPSPPSSSSAAPAPPPTPAPTPPASASAPEAGSGAPARERAARAPGRFTRGASCDPATPCAGGALCCASVCVDASSDDANCGACGRVCLDAKVCVSRDCACADKAGAGAKVASLSAGFDHTCALFSDGAVKCWGQNGFSQLGDGTTIDRRTPVLVRGLCREALEVASGAEHTCVLLRGGAVKCWGTNGYGQLGDGTLTTTDAPGPTLDLGGPAVSVVSGWYHSCALLADAKVKCWGWNELGQLGDGTTVDRRTPVTVAGIRGRPVALASGAEHVCAILSDGGVQCWGVAGFGQLGDGSAVSSRLTPVVNALAGPVERLDLGDFHTCAVLRGGALQCCGFNQFGQIGDGSTVDRLTPVTVPVGGPTSFVAGGYEHTCAVLVGGAVKCWGVNDQGQVGDGTRTERHSPVAVGLGAGAVAVSVALGYTHSCALLSDGVVKCWGRNALGQLGDGTATNRLTPVTVSGLP